MHNTVSNVLATLGKELLGLEGGIKNLSREFDKLGRTSHAMAGGLMFAFGAGAVMGVKKLVDGAKELSHEMAQIKMLNANMTPAQNKAILDWAADQPSRVAGTTTAGALHLYGGIQSLFGPEGAMKAGDALARFGQVVGSQSGDWDNVEDRVLKMVRAADLFGKFVDATGKHTDPDRMQKFLDLGVKVINATHGMITPETWLALAQQGGPGVAGMSDKGLMTMAMVMQGMGGFRAGTALSSIYQQFIGGRMTQYSAIEAAKLGLVKPEFIVGKGGHLRWAEGALDTPFTRAFKDDPLEAVRLMQRVMVAHGITTIDKQVERLYVLLSKQTSIREINDLLRNLPQMEQERPRLLAGMGVNAAANIANAEDYEKVLYNLHRAWTDMISKMGLPAAKAAIPMMESVRDFFLSMGKWAWNPKNQEDLDKLLRGITGFGLAFMGAGAAALFAALGPAGWFVFSVITLGTTWLVWGNDIKEMLNTLDKYPMFEPLEKIGEATRKLFDWGFEKIPGVFDKISDAIKSFLDKFDFSKPWEELKKGWNAPQGGSYEGGGFGVGGLYHRASFGGSARSFGGATGGGGGKGGWWTADRKAEAYNYFRGQLLMSDAGARGLVSRLANVESTGAGPAAINDLGGGHFGIAQWSRSRAGDLWGNTDFHAQLNHIAKEMRSTEWKAWEMLKSAKTDAEGAIGATQFERAEHFNKETSIDDWTGKTLSGMGNITGTRRRFGHPHIKPYHKADSDQPAIENVIMLDGSVIHRAVNKRMVASLTHPVSGPYHDSSRHWTPPDASLVGV